MRNSVYNSHGQHLLIAAYRRVSSLVNLHRGFLGKCYRWSYFHYKWITERHTLAAIQKYVLPGTLVIDVGAYIGAFSLYIVKNTGAHVLAFEPEHTNYRQLLTCMADYTIENRIDAFRLALSDKAGDTTLYLSDLAPTDHKLINSRSHRRVTVRAVTLDDFFEENKQFASLPISLIKIDVQGTELQVLHGMKNVLAINANPPILVEFSPHDQLAARVTLEEFFRAFANLGYLPHRLPDLTHIPPDSLIADQTMAYRDFFMVSRTDSR